MATRQRLTEAERRRRQRERELKRQEEAIRRKFRQAQELYKDLKANYKDLRDFLEGPKRKAPTFARRRSRRPTPSAATRAHIDRIVDGVIGKSRLGPSGQPTFVQRSRAVSSEEKAMYHHVLGAGRSRVKREFFALNADDERAIFEALERHVGRNVGARRT